MKFTLTGNQLKKLINTISTAQWDATVSVIESAAGLSVKISKFGTSELDFSKRQLLGDLWDIELIEEDISWLHKPYIPEIKLKIQNLVDGVKK